MRIDFSHSYPEVRKMDNGTFFVKLHFPEIGLYISGIRVVPSRKNEGELLVYKPALRTFNDSYKSNYEYENSSELWLYLKELAMKAVNEYDATQVFGDVERMDVNAEMRKAFEEMEGKAS